MDTRGDTYETLKECGTLLCTLLLCFGYSTPDIRVIWVISDHSKVEFRSCIKMPVLINESLTEIDIGLTINSCDEDMNVLSVMD